MIAPDDLFELVTTCRSETSANALAELILNERLAACVQVSGPIQSIYRWQGSVHRDTEYKLSAKSAGRCLDALQNFVAEHHEYEVPEVLVTRVVRSSDSYRDWVLAHVRNSDALNLPGSLDRGDATTVDVDSK